MSGAVYPIGFSYTLPVTVSDTVAISPGCVGLVNKNLTTNGVVKLTYYNDKVDTIPLLAGQYVAVARVKLVWLNGTTAGIATDISALYG